MLDILTLQALRVFYIRPLCTDEQYILFQLFPWSLASPYATTLIRNTTLDKTPLDNWSARRRELYLTTHNSHKRQTTMPPVVFKPTIPANQRQQTYALDRAASGIGWKVLVHSDPPIWLAVMLSLLYYSLSFLWHHQCLQSCSSAPTRAPCYIQHVKT
jgi:hypothetical protein